MSGTAMELIQLVDQAEVIKLVECQLCHEIPFPPIFMCITGHDICNVCKLKEPKCTICKKSWSHTRNFALEGIVRASRHTCPYRGNGCRDEPTGDQMGNHLGICTFRPFACPLKGYDGCRTPALESTETLDHLMLKHGAKKNYSGSSDGVCRFALGIPFKEFVNTNFGKGLYWPIVIHELEQKPFLIMCYTLENTFRVNVMHIEKEETSSMYRAKINLRGGKKRPGNTTSWNIPVSSVKLGSVLQVDSDMGASYVASCSPEIIKHIADRDEKNSEYIFAISCEIIK